MIKTVPYLFAVANGIDCVGERVCFYCGAPCDEKNKASEHVKDSFTGRSEVVAPGSQFVCNGCVFCLRESATLTMVDGTDRYVNKCAMRAFSWVVTKEKSLAGSKANIDFWRQSCCHPPAPPFAIVLSDSGQKQLLYRGVVCWSQEDVVVSLETERISYRPVDLIDAIDLCTKLIAATGKPALDESITPRFAQAVSDYFVEWEDLLSQWEDLYGKPIARLAAWLSPGRDAARETVKPTADAGLSGVSAKVGGSRRSKPEDRSERKGGSEGSGNPSLFDLCESIR